MKFCFKLWSVIFNRILTIDMLDHRLDCTSCSLHAVIFLHHPTGGKAPPPAVERRHPSPSPNSVSFFLTLKKKKYICAFCMFTPPNICQYPPFHFKFLEITQITWCTSGYVLIFLKNSMHIQKVYKIHVAISTSYSIFST